MIVLILKELRSNWRSFRYPAFLLVVTFFAILDPLMLKYMNEILANFATGIEIIAPDPTPEDAFLSYLSDVSQIGILVLIFMAMGSVAREKETGVTGWLLSKPISRWKSLRNRSVKTWHRSGFTVYRPIPTRNCSCVKPMAADKFQTARLSGCLS